MKLVLSACHRFTEIMSCRGSRIHDRVSMFLFLKLVVRLLISAARTQKKKAKTVLKDGREGGREGGNED